MIGANERVISGNDFAKEFGFLILILEDVSNESWLFARKSMVKKFIFAQ